MGSEPTTAAEMAALRKELEQVKTRVGQLERQRNDAIDALANATGLTRRQVLGIIGGGAGMGALGVLASGQARAAASQSDSDGDVGTPSSRADLFTDGINYSVADISSATTVTAPVVRYDCSVSGFTITLSSDLEPASGTQQVVLVDETGNAGTNAVTVDTQSGNGIDGGSSITINHDNAVTILIFDSGEWRSTRFIDTVDARAVVLDNLTNNLDGDNDAREIIASYPATNNNDWNDRSEVRTAVGTSATTIATVSNAVGCMVVIVHGEDETDNGRFHDLVFFSAVDSPTALSSKGTNSPAGRTYSRAGMDLQVAMASDTYEIRTRTIELVGNTA